MDNRWIDKGDPTFARTEGTDYGWDWSPAMAPLGVFGAVELVANNFAVMHPIVEQTLDFAETDKECISALLDITA